MARTPTYSQHQRLTFGGYLGPKGTPVEQWSINLSLAVPGDNRGTNVPLQNDMDDYASDFTAFMKRPETRWHGHANLTFINSYTIGPNGKSLAGGPDARWKGEVSSLGAGQSSSPVVPPQAALVVSLNKGSANRRHKGRVYLPFPQVGMDLGFVLDAGQCQGIATSFATLITDLNNMPGVDHDNTKVVVASTFGDITEVTDVRVGRRWDVMRSRAGDIPEAYVTAHVGG